MRKIVMILTVFIFCVSGKELIAMDRVSAPELRNNPGLDTIVTNAMPLLSFYNASGGNGKREYTIQIDSDPNFGSGQMIEYTNVPEADKFITRKMVDQDDALDDATVYFWRVRAYDSEGVAGPWAYSRFLVYTGADDHFIELTRVSAVKIEASSGTYPGEISDPDVIGQADLWQGEPSDQTVEWVKFDLGEKRTISRVWLLSNPEGSEGQLKDFGWQMSEDGKIWYGIKGAVVRDNDTYRNIIDFLMPVETRYLRLLITGWRGKAPRIKDVNFYSPGKPVPPEVPGGNYVLIVGNQRNGFTFTELARYVESLGLGVKTLTIPHYEISMEMLEGMSNKPIAIILSGNNLDYNGLPMFEYNGEYEIIRESEIPILGIGSGHHLLAMAYGYTYVASMEWKDTALFEGSGSMTEITIEKTDPVFCDVPDPFKSVETHNWAIAFLPEEYEVIARSSYIQAIRSRERMIYGLQFHPEIETLYNEGAVCINNFLKMAMENKNN